MIYALTGLVFFLVGYLWAVLMVARPAQVRAARRAYDKGRDDAIRALMV